MKRSLLPRLRLSLALTLTLACEPGPPHASSTSVATDTAATDEPLPAALAYWLPLACGTTATVGQGNDSTFSHTGDARHAFDILLALDTPVHAMAAGTVLHIYDLNQPGDPCHDGGDESCFALANLVVLAHADGTTTLYKHLNIVSVAEGTTVERGDILGLSGSTGWSTTPHLHVMRMQPCDHLQCPSIAMRFADVANGVPTTGQSVTSGNCPAAQPVASLTRPLLHRLGRSRYWTSSAPASPSAPHLAAPPAVAHRVTLRCRRPALDESTGLSSTRKRLSATASRDAMSRTSLP